MTSNELERASDALRSASDQADDAEAGERLETQAAQLAGLATDEHGPDHGRLARHEHVLTTIADEQGGVVAQHVEEALESIRTYRETLEGV